MRKIYYLIIACSLVVINISRAQVPGSKLFDNSKVHEVKIVSLYENVLDTLTANYILSFGINQTQIRDIPYAPAKLVIDGIVLDTLGVRYKGFNSWWQSTKKPIKIDINKYKSDQKYDGLKKFNLHNGSGDPSFIRENISYEILQLLGIKVPRTSYARVFIDTAYMGLYRIVEQIDNTFLDRNFGHHEGNLYVQQSKNTSGFSMNWLGYNQDAYYGSISLENHQNANDWSDFIHFLDILNNTPDDQFRDSLTTVFEVDEFLQILAFDIAVNNMDCYANSGRNFYLYNHNGIFHWLPWDYNLSWQEGSVPININPTNYPILIQRILQVPEFYDILMLKYCKVKAYFSDAFINNLITEEAFLISTYIENDPFLDYPFEAFQKNQDSAWLQIPGLKPYAVQRYAEISGVFENLHFDCNNTDVTQPNDQNIFQLYPVPANDWLNIGIFHNQNVSVSIMNSYGQLVMNTYFFQKGKINVSGIPSGCYIVKADAGGRVNSKLLFIYH